MRERRSGDDKHRGCGEKIGVPLLALRLGWEFTRPDFDPLVRNAAEEFLKGNYEGTNDILDRLN